MSDTLVLAPQQQQPKHTPRFDARTVREFAMAGVVGIAILGVGWFWRDDRPAPSTPPAPTAVYAAPVSREYNALPQTWPDAPTATIAPMPTIAPTVQPVMYVTQPTPQPRAECPVDYAPHPTVRTPAGCLPQPHTGPMPTYPRQTGDSLRVLNTGRIYK